MVGQLVRRVEETRPLPVFLGIVLLYGLVYLFAELLLADSYALDPSSCGTALTAAAEEQLDGPNSWVAVVFGIWMLACWSLPLAVGARNLPPEALEHWRWVSAAIAAFFSLGSVFVIIAHEFLVLILLLVFGLPVAYVLYLVSGFVIRRVIKSTQRDGEPTSRGAEVARSLRLDASIVCLLALFLGGYLGLLFGPLGNTLEVAVC